MALYRLEAKIVGRTAKDKAGKPIPGKQVSVIAKAAYRSGERLKDTETGRAFNYRSRSQEVVHSEIMTPDHAPDWMKGVKEGKAVSGRETRQNLWNVVERTEKRKDSQLAREFIISLPVELEPDAQIDAIRQFCRAEITDKGFVADFAIHKSHDGENPHCHVLATLRPVEGEGFGRKPDMSGKFNKRGDVGHGAKGDLVGWRKSWEEVCNRVLEKAGEKARVDSRSLKDRGIDRAPEPKVGVAAIAIQREGKEPDPERVRARRWAKMDNQIRSALRGIVGKGEITQYGAGGSWWERAQVAIGRVAEQGRELLRDESSGGRPEGKPGRETGGWQDYITSRRQNEPERDWPDMEPAR